MITQNIYIKDYDWDVKVYYAVDAYYAEEILEELLQFNPTVMEYYNVQKLMEDYNYNTGFTFTNPNQKYSLLVIGLTTCPAEFQSTFDHEKGHLATHIAQYYNIDPYGEEYQYLVGDIGKLMFPIAKQFLCQHCYDILKSNFRKY